MDVDKWIEERARGACIDWRHEPARLSGARSVLNDMRPLIEAAMAAVKRYANESSGDTPYVIDALEDALRELGVTSE